MDKTPPFKMPHRAVYAGSFDPVTRGHLDVIRRVVNQFGGCTVLVATNPEKAFLFTVEERVALVQRAVVHVGVDPAAVDVAETSGLVADFCSREVGSRAVLVRGLRDDWDVAYEAGIADFNQLHGVETVFFLANPSLSAVSSSRLKHMVSVGTTGGKVAASAPPFVVDAVRGKLAAAK